MSWFLSFLSHVRGALRFQTANRVWMASKQKENRMTTTNHEALWDAVGTPAPQASALTAIALCLHELVLAANSDHDTNLRIAETLEKIDHKLGDMIEGVGAVDRNLTDLGAEIAGVTQAVANICGTP